ncbi:MAG: ferredoxin family protein [Candidatus Binatia bacterium]
MAEIVIDVERCKGCAYCVIQCPEECIAMSDKFNSKGYIYPEFSKPAECTGCTACARLCPDFAITVYR